MAYDVVMFLPPRHEGRAGIRPQMKGLVLPGTQCFLLTSVTRLKPSLLSGRPLAIWVHGFLSGSLRFKAK